MREQVKDKNKDNDKDIQIPGQPQGDVDDARQRRKDVSRHRRLREVLQCCSPRCRKTRGVRHGLGRLVGLRVCRPHQACRWAHVRNPVFLLLNNCDFKISRFATKRWQLSRRCLLRRRMWPDRLPKSPTHHHRWMWCLCRRCRRRRIRCGLRRGSLHRRCLHRKRLQLHRQWRRARNAP